MPIFDLENHRFVLLKNRTGLTDESVLLNDVGGDDSLEACHLHLDFARLRRISSMDLGALVSLNKRMIRLRGLLTLVNVRPHIYEVFRVTHLHTYFDFHR